MERGRPCQFRSRGEMKFIKGQQSNAKKARVGKGRSGGGRRGVGGAHRKRLQNDEVVEYALGTAACFNLYLATCERFSRNTAH